MGQLDETVFSGMSPAAKAFALFSNPESGAAKVASKIAAVLPGLVSKADKVSTMRVPRWLAREGATGQDAIDTGGQILFDRARLLDSGEIQITEPGGQTFLTNPEELLQSYSRQQLEVADLVSTQHTPLDAPSQTAPTPTEMDLRHGPGGWKAIDRKTLNRGGAAGLVSTTARFRLGGP
jgi:hypothetical protein